MINHVWGLFTHPEREWQQIRKEDESIRHIYLTHTLLLAAIAPLCAYIGTTQVGWTLDERPPVLLTQVSALRMALLSYLTLLAGVGIMGGFIHWMARTYGARPSLARCIAFATYTATPLFIGGLAALYPHLWLGVLAGAAAIGYTVYLLYTGLPPFMNVSAEEGFMFSSAILSVGLVVLVAIMAFTVVLWGLGAGPQYIG
ncbi:hypothetical protein ASF84_06590 [Pseudomonas sp. Leaf127]|uniref:Yip1 family protein n=1 Tax=Pseudomonas sp. Leaf127 TaxID=1736267 RepID=UPI000703C268|nr:Yip1 family protein [Pseudomonas sp. Leaf127]KQQ56835.1 hypothetical protein ASF84_06590 [Pseudomonas sp. Leaf127]